MCPTQLPGSLISQHQQLLPQNTWHQRGRTQDFAKSLGMAGEQEWPRKSRIPEFPWGSVGALTSFTPPDSFCEHLLSSDPAMSLAGSSSQEWAPGIVSQVDREVTEGSKLSPRALKPRPPCSVSQGWEEASQVRVV